MNRRGFLGSLLALAAAPAAAALPSLPAPRPATVGLASPVFDGVLGRYEGIRLVEHIHVLQREANKRAVRALELLVDGEHEATYFCLVNPQQADELRCDPLWQAVAETRPQPGERREKPGRNLAADRRRWKGDALAWA